jgi:hypothetical protein
VFFPFMITICPRQDAKTIINCGCSGLPRGVAGPASCGMALLVRAARRSAWVPCIQARRTISQAGVAPS